MVRIGQVDTHHLHKMILDTIVNSSAEAYRVEKTARSGELIGQMPLLNPLYPPYP